MNRFRPLFNNQRRIKVNFYDKYGTRFVTTVPKQTIVSELPKLCLKDDFESDLNYLVYINDTPVENNLKPLSDYSEPIIIRFLPIYPKKSNFYTASNQNGKVIHFDTDDFFSLLEINPDLDIFIIFNSQGKIVNINKQNYKSVLKSQEDYYYIKFPRVLKELFSSINKKNFYLKIISCLHIKKSELQQLLCIFYKLDRNQVLKNDILNLIEEYNFIPLKFYTQKLLKSPNTSIINSEYFLPFLVSLPSIKINSKSYIEAFNSLRRKNDLTRSITPFKILNLRELFFNQNVEKDSFIQIGTDSFYLYRGESENDPEKSVYFDPIEEKEIEFDFTDLFLKECQSDNHINFEDIFFDTREYKLTKERVGEGGFGVVYIAVNQKNGKKYAAKIINTNNDFDGPDQMKLMRESMILKRIRHPSIIQFVGFNFQSFKNQQFLAPTILTEFLPNGSLRKCLAKNSDMEPNIYFNPTKKYINLLGITNAMRYLHHNGIVHRDLKPGNILIDENLYPQICDFDLARCFPDALTNSMRLTRSGEFGTPIYLAPEVLKDDDDHYGPGVDVYAFSIIAYEIIAEMDAFYELRKKITNQFQFLTEIIEKDARPDFNENFTEKMKDLLSNCWSKNISKRPSFDEIFKKLSTDFSYSKFEMDLNEIRNYLDKITKIPDPPNIFILDKIKVDVQDIEKIFFHTNEYKINLKQKIGDGAFSTVYSATKWKDDEKGTKYYSARIINTDLFKGYDQMILTRESLMLNKLKHPLIIKFFGLNFQSFHSNNRIKPTIINEYLKNGSLKNILQPKFFMHFDDTMKCICLIGIAHAMRFIHKQNIIHGFLSLDNVLLDEKNFPRIRFPHSFSNINQLNAVTHFHNQKYLAPEIFQNNSSNYGPEIDVYAFAILSYEILTGREAYCNLECKVNSVSFRSKIISGTRPKITLNFPREMSVFLSKCWSINAFERPSFDEIYNELLKNYSYLDDVDFEKVNLFIEKVLDEKID